MSRADHERIDKTLAWTIILVVLVVLFRLYVPTPTHQQQDFSGVVLPIHVSSSGGIDL